MRTMLVSALALGFMTSLAMAESPTTATKMSDADLQNVTASGYFNSSASAGASATAHGWLSLAGAYTGTYTAPGVASAYSSSYATSSGFKGIHKGGLRERKAVVHKDYGKGKRGGGMIVP